MAIPAAQFLWKIGAPAGLGVMTTGLTVSKLATRSGYHIYDYTEYPSLIKGGHNTYEVNICKEPVSMVKEVVDCLVCFDEQTYTLHQTRLTSSSTVVFDPHTFEPETVAQKIAVPMQELLNELHAEKVMVNMIGLGASYALLGGDFTLLTELIVQQFKRKGDAVVTLNTKCAQAGYEHVTKTYPTAIRSVLTPEPDPEARTVLAGNDAFALGAVAADCRFYAAYPMSPSSSVLEFLAEWQKKTGMVVRHAEDEIGVINEALGASFAGVRAAVGSSGGGFALMVETISYAGVAELPLVIFLAQRPGPATGMPTWTEQGDLLFAVHAGHGEFPKIVVAPGDPEEMLDLTLKAFDLADIYQTPVIVLSDKVLSESHYSIAVKKLETLMQRTIKRGKLVAVSDQHPYKRYTLTDDGISPRLIPGQSPAWYQANSYEHTSDSHTTEDALERIQQVDKRARKEQTYFTNDFEGPVIFGDIASADLVIYSWGGTKGTILQALREIENRENACNASHKWHALHGQLPKGCRHLNLAYLHFTHVHPLSPEKIAPLFAYQKPYLLVENNSTGQFGQLITLTTGFATGHKLLKYDGRPIFMEEVVTAIEKTLKIEAEQ
jgi:2-oxoglutarate ferredoxin oxidoreductase subunit alpha